ncbi:MAG: DUF4380 domain-containing protein [Fibrobacterales bacterium]
MSGMIGARIAIAVCILLMFGCSENATSLKDSSSSIEGVSSEEVGGHSSERGDEQVSSSHELSSEATSSSVSDVESSSMPSSESDEGSAPLESSNILSETSSLELSSDDKVSSSIAVVLTSWNASGSKYTTESGGMGIEIDVSNGGRVTSFTRNDTDILVFDEPSQGAIFWLSPQKDWPNTWPPSPEIDNKPYQVELLGDDSELVLTSEVDNLTGMTVEKKYVVNETKQRVEITYSILNTSAITQKVAPWANSRCEEGGITFFPTGEASDVSAPYFSDLPLDTIKDISWMHHTVQFELKAFEDGKEGWLAHTNKGFLYIQTFPDIPVDSFAPGETEVELFVSDSFIEVEYQGAYVSLEPGDRLDWITHWYLIELEATIDVAVGSDALVALVREILGIK